MFADIYSTVIFLPCSSCIFNASSCICHNGCWACWKNTNVRINNIWSLSNILQIPDIFPAGNVQWQCTSFTPLVHSRDGLTDQAKVIATDIVVFWVQLSSDLLGLMSVMGEIPFCFHLASWEKKNHSICKLESKI